jgi:hypothetical protein
MNTPITNPTALADQLQAAATDARAAVDRLAHAANSATHQVSPTGWFGQQVTDLLTALTTGAGRACQHLGAAPAVIHAAAWRPGHIVCPACVAVLRADPDEDTTCDRCRTHAGPLHAGAVAVGPVVLAYGLCRTCVTAVGLTPTTRRPRSVTDEGQQNRPATPRRRRRSR